MLLAVSVKKVTSQLVITLTCSRMNRDSNKCRMPRLPPRHFSPRGRGGRPPFRPRGRFPNGPGFYRPRPPFRGMAPWRCPRPPIWQRPVTPKVRTVSNSSDGTVPPGTESSPESTIAPSSRPLLPTPKCYPEPVSQPGTSSTEEEDSQISEEAFKSSDLSTHSLEIPACLTALFPQNPLAALRFNGPLPACPPSGITMPPANYVLPAFDPTIAPPGTADYSCDFAASTSAEETAYSYLQALDPQFGFQTNLATNATANPMYPNTDKEPVVRKPVLKYSYMITNTQMTGQDGTYKRNKKKPKILCYVEMFELANSFCTTYYFGGAAERAQQRRNAESESNEEAGVTDTLQTVTKPSSPPPGVQSSAQGNPPSPSIVADKDTSTAENKTEDGNNNVEKKLNSVSSVLETSTKSVVLAIPNKRALTETSTDPVVAEASTVPLANETSTDPAVTETFTDPAVAETSTDPALAKTSTDPAVAETSTDPLVTETSTDPTVVETSTDPALAKTSTDPAVAETSTDPVVTETSTDPSVTETSTDPSVTETSTDPVVTGTSTDPLVTEMTVSETSVPSSVSETCEETVNVTTMTKPLTTAAGDRAIATVKPSMAKVIENRLSRLPTSTATFNVDSDGCYTINDLLAFEPPQSAPTMFRLLIWEVYQRYFSMRPMVEMQIFLFARLYRLLVHEISADATFTCGMKCSMSKSKMSFKEYLSHVETLEHVENTVRFINRKQPFGWKALRNTLGRRSWFCEICTDFETTKAYRSRDIKRHLHTSQEHKRRHALILEYLQDVKSEQHTQKTICPIPKRIQTIQSEFQRLTRHKVEFWMRSRNPKDKFKCTLQKCKDMTFNSIEEYLDHCQSYYHMLTMYSYFHSLGASNVFNEYIKLSRYSAMDKRYFCGICAWRRPSDNLEVDSLLSHTKSREHERNLELLTECFRRDEQRCIYRCADNCSIDHAPLLFTKRKTVEVPNLTKPSTSSTSNPRIQLTWKPSTSVLPSPTADALRKFSASADTAATISTSGSNSSIDKLSEAFPARKWAKSTIAKKGTTLVASALAEAVARAKKRSEEILEDLAAHSSSRKTASGSNLSEIHSLDKHVIKSASNPLAAKVIPQMRVSSQPVIADSPGHSDKFAPATSTGSKPVFRLSSKTMQDILQEARAAENQEKKTFGASPTVTSKEYNNYLSNDLSGLKTQPAQKPHIYDSDDSSKPVSLMCKIPLSAVPVTDHLKKESKHQKKKHKKAKKAKKQTKTKLPMAYSDPNVSRSPDCHRSRRKTSVSDLSDDDQYSKSSEYTTGSKRSHRRSQSPDQNRKRPRTLYSSSSDKTYGSSRSRSNETRQRRRRRSRSYGSSDDSEGKKSKFKTKKGESYSVSKHRQHQSSSRSPRSSYRKSYSYERNKEHLRRKPRRNTSSSSLDSTKQSTESKYTKTRRRKRSRSSSFSNSSYNHSPSPHRRNFSSSRSRSHSPRSRRYSRWSRSRSKSDSPDFKGNRLSRHLSPPPFPQHNFSIYCIGDGGDHPRLTMRSLSPMSEDTVSKTVENAWNVYYNRYYSKKSYSLDDVLNSQYVFLKSYSGFFTTPSNFENCYDTSLKPEDLKSALRLRLSRLSPGPTRKSSELHLKQPKKKLPSSTHVNLPTAVKTKDTALSMESLIRTGAVPGLAMLNDNSSPTAVTNTHDIQSAIQSLRQSFSQANLKKENPEQSTCQSGSTLKTATADSKYSFLPLHSSNSDDKSAIPFLNDGTLAQRKSSPRRDSPAQSVKQPQDTETPWHYSERWSPTDQYKDQAKDKAIAKRKTSGRTRPSRFSDPIPTTTVETPLSASSSFEQPSSVKPLVSYYEDDSSDMVEGNDAEENEAVKSPENPVKPSDQVHAVGGVVMSAFIGEVVRGIIRLSTLPGDEDLSPEQRDAETELERSQMHSRMTSAAGHYMIHMARCRLSQPERLTKDFTEADAEAVDLIQSMDDRVVELIASTPFLDD